MWNASMILTDFYINKIIFKNNNQLFYSVNVYAQCDAKVNNYCENRLSGLICNQIQ